TASCPKTRNQVFIAGTQPVEICRLHGGGRTVVAGWESSPRTPPPAPVPAATPESKPPQVASVPPQSLPSRTPRSIPVTPASPPQAENKKGFFGRLRDIFK